MTYYIILYSCINRIKSILPDLLFPIIIPLIGYNKEICDAG
jgi:hypothetical protein